MYEPVHWNDSFDMCSYLMLTTVLQAIIKERMIDDNSQAYYILHTYFIARLDSVEDLTGLHGFLGSHLNTIITQVSLLWNL